MSSNRKPAVPASTGTAAQPGNHLSRKLPSSHGDSPVEITPKDVTPQDVTWNDRKPRDIHSGNDTEREEALIDEAVDLTFPASDPVAELPASAASEKTEACSDSDECLLDDAIEMTFPASDPIAFTPPDRIAVPSNRR